MDWIEELSWSEDIWLGRSRGFFDLRKACRLHWRQVIRSHVQHIVDETAK